MKATILVLFSFCFTMILQAQVSKTAYVTAGNLKTVLTAIEQNTVTYLTLTGTIDARDFKTMRDDMPLLSDIDLSGVTVAAYSGFEGTEPNPKDYPGNTIPVYAFYDQTSFKGKSSLRNIVLPNSVTSIGNFSFYKCSGLTSLIIPLSVVTVGYMSIYGCGGLTSTSISSNVYTIGEYAFCESGGLFTVDPENPGFSSLEGVLFNKEKTVLIQCPSSKSGNYEIPSTVASISNGAFWGCNFTSIHMHSLIPIDLSFSSNVFKSVDKTTCILYVPVGTKNLYAAAGQWKDFTSIVEVAPEFQLSSTVLNVESAAGSTATASITFNENVLWTASSDQAWLTVNPGSGTGDHIITFTAEANTTVVTRTAKVTISPKGGSSQNIKINQDGLPKTIKIAAGSLFSYLTDAELNGITNLTITGTIDVRDFKTMRDNMPSLAVLDISGAKILAFYGSYYHPTYYGANIVPKDAFYNPDTHNGKISLRSVKLPSSVTSIGERAFAECIRISSIDLPSSLTSIASSVFYGCTGLNSIVIPPRVKLIGDYAFSNCISLITVTVPSSVNSISSGAFMSCSKLTSVTIPSSISIIENQVFYGCSSLTSITIPSSVTSIGSQAFDSCSSLTSIAIPTSVTSIGAGAFSYCRRLTSITIPGSVTSIGGGAFSYCSSLTSVRSNSSLPVNLTSFPGVFSGINKTTCSLNVPYKAKELYATADQWRDFTNIVEAAQGFLPDSTIISFSALGGSTVVNSTAKVTWTASSDQTWLTLNPTSGTGNQAIIFTAEANSSIWTRIATVSVSAPGYDSQTIKIIQDETNLPVNVTAGGLKALFTTEELKSITKLTLSGTMDARDFKTMRDNMPLLAELDLSGVNVADYTGTDGTAGNNSINYPENRIPDYAFCDKITFSGKISLNSVILPISISAIGNCAFSNCDGLYSINIPSLVTSIGYSSFYFCRGLTSITIPVSVTSIGENAFQGSNGMIIVDENNLYYSSVDGVLFNKPKTTLIQCPISKTGTYAISSSVTTINYAAFSLCSNITSLNLPSSITSIGNYAFANCYGLTSFYIPSSITYIGISPFWYCINLNSITVERSLPLNLSSSPNVFFGVNKLTCKLYVPYGTKALYAAANQWKDFNIVESQGVKLSSNKVTLDRKQGSSVTLNVASNTIWTTDCDKSWLIVAIVTANGKKTLTFTAAANNADTARTAMVLVTGIGFESQTILVTQEGTPVGVNDITETSAQFKCYPNPFNSVTTISWQLTKSSRVTLKIFDIVGKEVAILVDEQRPSGKYEIQFNAAILPKGIYFYQLKAGEFNQTRKMILLE